MAAVLTCKDQMRIENESVPEEQLVRDARSGDIRAFEVLFDRYYDMIHAFAYRTCLAESEADDIAQETFIRAARSIFSFRGEASFKNWLYRIAHHVMIDARRRNFREKEKRDGLAAELASRGQKRGPEYLKLHEALQALSGDLREAVALVYFEEMNHREAARVLGCAETTVSWRIFQARRALKNILSQGAAQ